MQVALEEMAEVSLNECTLVADRMNMMNIVPDNRYETYETAPLVAMPTASLSDEELHTLFESAINGRLLAMREQMQRISGPLAPLPGSQIPQISRYKTDTLQFVDISMRRVPLFCGSWRKTLLYGSLGLMLATLGFDIMGLIVLYTR